MPPTPGGAPLRRAFTALISSISMIVLTLVAAFPAASASAAVTVKRTDTATATITSRSARATAATYTDRLRRSSTKHSVTVAKVKRGRYQTY